MKIRIKKGHDLLLAGAVGDADIVDVAPAMVAVSAEDFHGFTAKVMVKPGDKVKIGSPLVYNKSSECMKLTSPVSGTVTEVVRGERRRLLRVVVCGDGEMQAERFDVKCGGADAVTTLLANSGLLAMFRQRPYDTVVTPGQNVRDIFVTAFDSAPLAVVITYSSADVMAMEAAVKALKLLTTGDVYISRRSAGQLPDVKDAVMVDVSGPHPAGNAGVQIANIRPVNKGEIVWTLTADTLLRIGRLLLTGVLDTTAHVALCGSAVDTPVMARTVMGVAIKELLAGEPAVLQSSHVRIISGNVLTGVKVSPDDFLRFPYTQVTVIPEGDNVDEFMGWASLSPWKMSVNPSFPGAWFRHAFRPDARMLGGRRAMIMSGIIDKVLPMDIMGEYLVKAINARDIDRMEQLGIYEVAPEDFALAECLDSSKVPYQAIVRQGLDFLMSD